MRLSYTPRLLRKFESVDTLTTVEFPLIDYEYESTQDMRVPSSEIVAEDYGFDFLGSAPGFRNFGEETVRFSIYSACDPADLDSEMDSLRAGLYRIGVGKGWTVDRNGVLRWAYMRLSEMPAYAITDLDTPFSQKLIAVTAHFRRQSDWFAEDQISKTQTITSSPATVVVNNPGNIAAKRVQITFKANAVGGYNNPKVVNAANGHELETTGAVVDSTPLRIQLDTTIPVFQYSTDNGVSYNDAFIDYVLPPNTQKILTFDLEPGDNSLTITSGGTPNFDIIITADAAYA